MRDIPEPSECDVSSILRLVTQFFDDDAEKTALWFETPNPLLGGASPYEMIRLGHSEKLRRFVMEALSENRPCGSEDSD